MAALPSRLEFGGYTIGGVTALSLFSNLRLAFKASPTVERRGAVWCLPRHTKRAPWCHPASRGLVPTRLALGSGEPEAPMRHCQQTCPNKLVSTVCGAVPPLCQQEAPLNSLPVHWT